VADLPITEESRKLGDLPMSSVQSWTDTEEIKIVEFARLECANALDLSTTEMLSHEILSVPDEIKVIVLRSKGRVFSAGADFELLQQIARERRADFTRSAVYGAFQGLIRSIATCPVPVIVEVQGAALGAGADLVLSCDLCVAGEEASIEETWSRYGLISALGGSFELTRAVGRFRALEIMLSARRVTSQECLSLGLFNVVVPGDSLRTTTMKLAANISALDRATIEACKSLIRSDSQSGLATYSGNALDKQLSLIMSENFRDQVGAIQHRKGKL
jgi:enoyl-CoA hydratase/carnithine racemase